MGPAIDSRLVCLLLSGADFVAVSVFLGELSEPRHQRATYRNLHGMVDQHRQAEPNQVGVALPVEAASVEYISVERCCNGAGVVCTLKGSDCRLHARNTHASKRGRYLRMGDSVRFERLRRSVHGQRSCCYHQQTLRTQLKAEARQSAKPFTLNHTCPTPYTLHPTPYTPYTIYTLHHIHPTPYTIYTLHHIHPTPYTLHSQS